LEKLVGKIITIIGNTGVGKTTLARALANAGGFNLGIEQHDTRPFQALFKSDARYALANQIDYLLLRIEQERLLRQMPQTGLVDGGLEQDFHGFTRLFHARGLLGEPEFEICQRLYRFCRAALPEPELIIHLVASNEKLKQRLAGRDRINIAGINDLITLDSFLNEWLATLPNQNVIQMDVSNLSVSYFEVIPMLLEQIESFFGKDSARHESGYIP
jgi:deoxyadenosine/deoxycytidine kinase